MKESREWEQARYIYTTGRQIYDEIDQVVMAHLLASPAGQSYRDLTLSQLHAVMLVEKNGSVSMSRLAEQMRVSPPSASAMVDRLVEKGLLVREHSTQDRRKVVVAVSPCMSSKCTEIEKNLLTFFVNLVRGLGPETAVQWCAVLSRIKTELDRQKTNSGARPAN